MALKPDMVGLVVKDMAKSLAFYRLLGMDIPAGVENEPYVDCITPNGYRFSWNTESMVKEIVPEWIEPQGQRIGVAFKCDGVEEVDATYAKITAAGHNGHMPPWDAFWGQRYAVVTDPDGNNVDIFAPLPNAEAH